MLQRVENLNFAKILAKNRNFGQKSKFCSKIEILLKNRKIVSGPPKIFYDFQKSINQLKIEINRPVDWTGARWPHFEIMIDSRFK